MDKRQNVPRVPFSCLVVSILVVAAPVKMHLALWPCFHALGYGINGRPCWIPVTS